MGKPRDKPVWGSSFDHLYIPALHASSTIKELLPALFKENQSCYLDLTISQSLDFFTTFHFYKIFRAMAVHHEAAQVVGGSGDKIYYFTFTTSTFMKREKPLAERTVSRITGKPVENPWFKERFQNEAAALQLLRSQTKIPVPGLRSRGGDSEGLLFLKTDLAPGVQLERAGDECRMPNLHSPNGEKIGKKCDQCFAPKEKHPKYVKMLPSYLHKLVSVQHLIPYECANVGLGHSRW